MPYKNKSDQRKAWRAWRSRNITKDNQRVKKRKNETRTWFREYKTNLKCNRCPEDHPACLEFHHKNGDKDLEIAYMVNQGYSKKRILKEIEKCEVLCANCHRKEHHPL